MDVENTFIKPLLSFYFGKGMDEVDTRKEISVQYPQLAISSKLVNKWFVIFRKGELKKAKRPYNSKKKITDESLIDLIKENPSLSMEKLARLADTTSSTISKRLKQINCVSEKVKYVSKINQRNRPATNLKPKPVLTDEFLIKLVNNNPDLTMKELAVLADTTQSNISRRIKQINSKGKSINYRKKDSTKFTDEYLIDLINKNPGFNMRQLAVTIGASEAAVSTRLKQINSNGERVKYLNKKIHKSSTNENSNGKPNLTDEFIIELINKNPSLSLERLSRLANVSTSVLSSRLKQINSDGERVTYLSKKIRKDKVETNEKPKQRTKLTDEYLINLINENPDLCMRELATIADISQSTISYRLKFINISGKRANYVSKKSIKERSEVWI